MFTGLVEEIGVVRAIKKSGNSLKIEIGCKELLKGAKVGDSIATNGVCLTAVEIGEGYFVADAMPETFEKTNLKRLSSGSNVNLEKSLTLNSYLGGHLVTGDVDCEGIIKSISKDEIAIKYVIEFSGNYGKYLVEKGRITIDGASLTLTNYSDNSLEVSLIPHTQDRVVLGGKKSRDSVNLEFDLIGKYVERMLGFGDVKAKKKIGIDFLKENGFA